MAKLKSTICAKKGVKKETPKQLGKEKKEKVRWAGKSIKQARQAIQQAAKARKDAKSRPYHHQPGSNALHEIWRYQKCTELLIRKNACSKVS